MRKLVVLLITIAAASGYAIDRSEAQAGSGAAAAYDLNGEWQAEYHNPEGVAIERIMIVNMGTSFTATKTTGDQYVPAGKQTLRGTPPSSNATSFSVEQQCAGAGFVNPKWGKVTVTISDNDHFTLRHDCPSDCACGATEAWQRVGKPTLALDNAVLFDLDKSKLRPDADAALTNTIAWLNEKHPTSHLLVAGYTDNTGAAKHNVQLSNDRAATVAAALVAKGIDKSRLSTKGFGAANPRYPNTNDDARARNRRVEIVIED